MSICDRGAMGECLRYDDTELDAESLRKAKEELKESDEVRRKCLEILKKQLTEREDLHPCLKDDFLLAFLRVAKFDCTKASQRIFNFYEQRWDLPEVYQDYLPSTVKTVEIARQIYACPYRNEDHSAVMIYKRGDYDPSKIPFDLIVRGIVMIGDIIYHHPLNQLCGFNFIMDLKTSAWGSWSEYTPSRLKFIAKLVQKCMPTRIQKFHIINAPPVYYFLYSIMYPFLTVKIRNRIVLHKNCKSLHTYIKPENLPKEYGGYLENSDLINMFERLYKMEDFFEEFSKYGFIKNK